MDKCVSIQYQRAGISTGARGATSQPEGAMDDLERGRQRGLRVMNAVKVRSRKAQEGGAVVVRARGRPKARTCSCGALAAALMGFAK